MKKIVYLMSFLAFIAGASAAKAQVQVGLAVNQGSSNFYLSIGSYYQVPPDQVTVIQQRNVPDEELPVACFIAQRAHVAPGVVVDWRLAGHSWMDVALHFGVGADAFYVPLHSYQGTPYERASLWFARHPRSKWHRFRLQDAEIINFVNLRFLADRYHRPYDEIARYRAQGHGFVEMHENYRTNSWHSQPAPMHQDHPGNAMGYHDDHMDHHDDHYHDNGGY